ncbi:MAG: thioredoxin [Candidatus Pacebacteria bacterium]|jgi:thioredoxin 1|nr:thioredoxin [Candidatus Paceibacterota bacterium]
MPAQHLDSSNFQSTLDNAKTPVLVDFFAEWCGPCQMAAPIIDKLANDYKDKIIIAKLNVDEARDVAGQFNVMSIPTVIIFKKDDDGKMQEHDRKIGFPGESGYQKMIEEALA